MADFKQNLSRPRFLKGFLGASVASVFLGKTVSATAKNNQDGSTKTSHLQVRQDPRSVSREN